MTDEIVLPDAGAAAVTNHVKRFGAESVETGGFFLAPRGEDAISIVCFTGSVGIVRHRHLFQVSDLALDRLFGYADAHDLWIPAQFHSHGLAAFMSPTDIDHGLSVKDFVTAIVPFFAAPPPSPLNWGWWRYNDAWIPTAPPSPSTAPISVLSFDESGVFGA